MPITQSRAFTCILVCLSALLIFSTLVLEQNSMHKLKERIVKTTTVRVAWKRTGSICPRENEGRERKGGR